MENSVGNLGKSSYGFVLLTQPASTCPSRRLLIACMCTRARTVLVLDVQVRVQCVGSA